MVEGTLKGVNVHPQGYGTAVGEVSYSASKVGSGKSDYIPKTAVFSERRVPKDQLMEVQSLLIKLGFNPGPADGIIGPKTLEAVRKYQKSNGMEVDGKISEKLLEQLRKSY